MATRTEVNLLVAWGECFPQPSPRETGMVAGMLHLALVILILINPQVFSAKEKSPEEIEHQLTLLYLPTDLIKIPEPRTEPDLTAEERKRAVIRTPLTVDPRELQRILPPPLPPGVSPAPPALPGGETPAPSVRAERSTEDALAERRKQMARLEDIPRPADSANQPTIDLPSVRPGRSLEELLRRGPRGPGGPSLPSGDLGYPLQPNFNTPYPVILSDTRGVDFGPYLIRLLTHVRGNWYAVIPESVRVLGEQGRVVIVFTILKDGVVPYGQPKLVQSSGRTHLDRPALAAIRAAQPFAALPEEFTGDHIVLQFTFLYNLPVDYTGP
jgi:TonB family protein